MQPSAALELELRQLELHELYRELWSACEVALARAGPRAHAGSSLPLLRQVSRLCTAARSRRLGILEERQLCAALSSLEQETALRQLGLALQRLLLQ